MFSGTFEAVAALLAIGVLGFWLISRRIVPANVLGVLSRLALEVALPCLIFSRIITRLDPATNPDWWKMPLLWAAFTVCAGCVTLVFLPLAARGTRREFGFALFYQNATFFPLVIIAQMRGAGVPRLVDLFLFTMFFSAFLFNTYPLVLHGHLRGIDWRKTLHPVLIVTASAVVLKLTGLHTLVPAFLVSSFEMVGQMAVPLLMLILGGNIYVDFRRRGKFQWAEVTKFVLIKNFAFPLVAVGALMLLRPGPVVATLILLESAVPPITSVPILIDRVGGNRNVASQFVVASFLCSVISIPLMLALLHWTGLVG
ncbi:MAG: AEC family transporter [Candidatus Brocadiia bacterium]